GRGRAGLPGRQGRPAFGPRGARHDRQVGGRRRAASRRPSAHAAPYLRHSSLGERRRPAGDPGAARPRLAVDDAEVHPPRSRTAARGLPRRPPPRPPGVWPRIRMSLQRFESSPGGVILAGRRRLRTLLVGLTLLMLAAAIPWTAWRMSGDLDPLWLELGDGWLTVQMRRRRERFPVSGAAARRLTPEET